MIYQEIILSGIAVLIIIMLVVLVPIMLWKELKLPIFVEYENIKNLNCIQTDKKEECKDYETRKRSWFHIKNPSNKWLCCNKK